MKFSTRGLIAPVFTPFRNNGDLNLEILDSYYKYLLQGDNLDGILVNGTSGEGMSMNLEERKTCAEAWIKIARRKLHVMVQVGGAPLPDVLHLAKHAEAIKADSILCLPDLYMKPKTIPDLIAYLKLVSDAAPNTPLLYYHIPMFSNVTIHMGEFLRQVKNAIPTFVGLKFTSNDLDEGYEAVIAENKKFAVFLGADTLILSAKQLGFNSSIATTLNICPQMGRLILKSPRNDDCSKIQLQLNGLVKEITKYGGWVPSMKAAMNILTPIDCGPVRPPMISLTKEQVDALPKDFSGFVESYSI